MKKIKLNKGLSTATVHNTNGTVTVYSIATVEAENYCRNHNGNIKIDEIIYEWSEDCECSKDN